MKHEPYSNESKEFLENKNDIKNKSNETNH